MARAKTVRATKGGKGSASSQRNGRGTHPKKGRGKSPVKPIQWKAMISSYAHLRALTFASREDFDAAIALVWTEELIEMPHDLVGSYTMIVPPEAVPFFKRSGLKFEDTEVLSAGDLPPEEIAQLRREQGGY